MPEPQRPLKVFLCHASQDKPAVRELSQRLYAEGWIDAWLDEKKLLPGQDWRLKIEEAVETSDIVIICLSSNSVSKEGFIQKELRYAREIALEKPDETIFLIPLRMDDCTVPRGLRFYQWADYFGEREDETYSALLGSLKIRYEQKLRIEEELNPQEEEKQEREAAEKAEREKAERATREKLEREAVEKAKREKAEREAAAKLAQEKIEKENQRRREKKLNDTKRRLRWEKFLTNVRYRLSLMRLYSVPILLGLAAIVLLVYASYYLPQNTRVQSPTPTDGLTLAPQPTLTSTEIFMPTEILTMTATLLSSTTVDCRYAVKTGDTFFQIAEQFEIGGANWSVISCAPEDSNGCDLPNPENIRPGSIVIIPNVNRDVCLQNGGEPDISSAINLPTEITDANGVQMVLVPAGNFMMGSDNGESDEKPVHTVYLDTYYIDKYEVTNALYKICVDAEVCQSPQGDHLITDYYGNPNFADYPVMDINWDMAKTHCEWRGAQLPTEAQWEKAARGTDGSTYPWGDGIDQTFAHYDQIGAVPAPVGTYESGKSLYGAYDMAGNAWEWVADWYSKTFYANSPSSNPSGPGSGQQRVLRGGVWYYGKERVRASARDSYDPVEILGSIGFRCAKDANP